MYGRIRLLQSLLVGAVPTPAGTREGQSRVVATTDPCAGIWRILASTGRRSPPSCQSGKPAPGRRGPRPQGREPEHLLSEARRRRAEQALTFTDFAYHPFGALPDFRDGPEEADDSGHSPAPSSLSEQPRSVLNRLRGPQMPGEPSGKCLCS